MTHPNTRRGFTLIELLVVVIIIAVLAAVAWPQYKQAVLKSRFSTVMPMAKAVADAQEVYYLGKNMYALGTDELDVTPTTAENTSVTLSEKDGYDYVLAQRTDIPQLHYVIYQKHSEQFPDEIHCEALKDDTSAEKICRSLGATKEIGETLTSNFITYVLSGTGNKADTGTEEEEPDVELDAETLAKLQAQAENCPDGYECFVNEKKGTVTRCRAEYGQIVDGECVSTDKATNNTYQEEYDADGKLVEQLLCRGRDAGECVDYQRARFTYNAEGSKETSAQCAGAMPTSKGICPNGNYTYAYEVSRDTQGQRTSSYYCDVSSIGKDGKCGTYSSMETIDRSYDTSGDQLLTQKKCVDISGTTCNSYVKWAASYTPADGNSPQISISCSGTIQADGSCSGSWSQIVWSSPTVWTTCSGKAASAVNWETATCK